MSAREKSPAETSAPVVLLGEIRQLIDAARQRAATAVNSELTLLYWRIGQRIHTQVLVGQRAEYGEEIVATLSQQLMSDYGRGFSYTALTRMVKFYEIFPDEQIVATLSQQLSWSDFQEILPQKRPLQREYYAEMCRVERWRMAQWAHSNNKGDKENLKCQVGISSSPSHAVTIYDRIERRGLQLITNCDEFTVSRIFEITNCDIKPRSAFKGTK